MVYVNMKKNQLNSDSVVINKENNQKYFAKNRLKIHKRYNCLRVSLWFKLKPSAYCTENKREKAYKLEQYIEQQYIKQKAVDTLKVLGWFVVILFAFVRLAYIQQYQLNISSAYPPGIYKLKDASSQYHRGDLVMFCPPSSIAITNAVSKKLIDAGGCASGSVPLIKRIVATQNDKVRLSGSLQINERKFFNGKILTEDVTGWPLTSSTYVIEHEFNIPSNMVFMYLDYLPETNIDSRHFGPVAIENIKGVVKPVLIF